MFLNDRRLLTLNELYGIGGINVLLQLKPLRLIIFSICYIEIYYRKDDYNC